MKLNYNSYYKAHAGKTLNWLPLDSEDLYNQNFKNRYTELKRYNWIDQQFNYTFNTHGFRCDEFTNDPTVMFLGCSLTCGVGLPLDTIWPELVAKQLGMQCANLGIGAGSNDTAFRLCLGWIDRINPKILVFASPHCARTELLLPNEQIVNLSPQWVDEYSHHLKIWTLDDGNSAFNKLKNSIAIQHLCALRNIKYVEVPAATKLQIIAGVNNDYARDLAHPGINCNRVFSKLVLDQIELAPQRGIEPRTP